MVLRDRPCWSNCCRDANSVAGVNDLLENTHLALGLKLERGEATALVSMLDTNGDKSIQCEELEVRMHR